jgi:hypothetical protein
VRAVLAALVLSVVAGQAGALGLGLKGAPAQCVALESLVVYGLIDGGEGGDTAELTAVVNAGDARECQIWLNSYGIGRGFKDPDCATAFEIFARDWPGEDVGEIQSIIVGLLTPESAQYCDDMLFDLTAGQ